MPEFYHTVHSKKLLPSNVFASRGSRLRHYSSRAWVSVYVMANRYPTIKAIGRSRTCGRALLGEGHQPFHHQMNVSAINPMGSPRRETRGERLARLVRRIQRRRPVSARIRETCSSPGIVLQSPSAWWNVFRDLFTRNPVPTVGDGAACSATNVTGMEL
jgi:hypothetical protein